jgi:ribosome biogenesis protein NSA2
VISKKAQTLRGIKAKLFSKERFRQKVQMKKTIREHEEKGGKTRPEPIEEGAVPAYLMDREQQRNSKLLTNSLKQKRKEKAGRWSVPLEKVKPMSEAEMFEVIRSGKRKQKCWKRRINKVCFVGEGFTRKPPKHERFIRPMGLRFKEANVTHPELKTTFKLPILSVKKNPQSNTYTSLGVITKGTLSLMQVPLLKSMSLNWDSSLRQAKWYGLSTHRSRTALSSMDASTQFC